MGLRQPHLQGHHAGLRAEAEDDEKGRRKQRLFIADKLPALCEECEVVPLGSQEEEAQQRERRAERGVAEIGKARPARLLRPVVQHEGHGAEGHELKAHVERHGVCRERKADEGCVGQQEKAEELRLLPLVLHIAEGVKLHKEPDEAHEEHEEKAQIIPVKMQGERVTQAQERDIPGEEGRRRGDKRRRNGRDTEPAALGSVLRPEDKDRAGSGDQDCEKHQHIKPPPFT